MFVISHYDREIKGIPLEKKKTSRQTMVLNAVKNESQSLDFLEET